MAHDHGVKRTPAGSLYRLGAALFDLETAEYCVVRLVDRRTGNGVRARTRCGYVTFPCGYTLDADGNGINLCYGAADTSVALAKASIAQLLE